MIDSFLSYLQSIEYSPGTLKEYRRILAKFFQFLERKNITDVTLQILEDYRLYLSETYTRRGRLSVASRNQAIACLKSYYNWHRKTTGIPSPAEHLRQIKGEERLPDFLTREQLASARLGCRNILDGAIIEVLFNTGIRASELLGCNLESLSLSRKELRIMGKGKKERRVPLSTYCCQILEEYIAWRSSIQAKDESLFTSPRMRKRLTYNQLYYLVKKVSGKRPHLFRHTLATYLLEGGATIKEVQEILGHIWIESTARYTHITPRMKEIHEEIVGRKEG